jgi:hypothetical protein
MPSGEVTGPGVRLRELTQHSFGVRVRFHLAATVPPRPCRGCDRALRLRSHFHSSLRRRTGLGRPTSEGPLPEALLPGRVALLGGPQDWLRLRADLARHHRGRRCGQAAAGPVRAAGAVDGPTVMGVGGRVLSGTLDIRFAYVSAALEAARIVSVDTGRAFGPPTLSERGSRYFLGRRW